MTYYKVKPEYDQHDKFVFVGSSNLKIKHDGFLIGNELYTAREREKITNTDRFFDIVKISKKEIYWFFGARFSAKTGGLIHYD